MVGLCVRCKALCERGGPECPHLRRRYPEQPVTDTEQQPAPLDEFERLELIHQRMKAEQEAWRKLLESLDEAKRKRMNKTPNDHTNA